MDMYIPVLYILAPAFHSLELGLNSSPRRANTAPGVGPLKQIQSLPKKNPNNTDHAAQNYVHSDVQALLMPAS